MKPLSKTLMFVVATILALGGVGVWLMLRPETTGPPADLGPPIQGPAVPDMPAEHQGAMGGAKPAMAPPIQLTPQRQQLIGVKTSPVEKRDLERHIRTVGRVDYDERRLAVVNLRFEGWIEDLLVDYTGRPVRKGETLFSIYSPDLVSTQQEYLLTVETRHQLARNPYPEIVAAGDSLLKVSRERLLLWGLMPEQIQALEERGTVVTALPILSPIDGIIIEKMALKGMHVTPGTDLFKIADLSRVWVYADLYEYELPSVRVGQLATISLSYYPGEAFQGRVAYVYPFLERETRTAKVRFEVPNPGLKLKPGMYANVELKVPAQQRLALPASAVIHSGVRDLVFVDQGGGLFEPREVKLGAKAVDYYEVLEGVRPGEQVVTSGNFLLDAESRLSAGVEAFEPAVPQAAARAPAQAGAEARLPAKGLRLEITTAPSPARVGDNQVIVTVADPDGQPVDDARVEVTFFMPAMAAMPAMSAKVETAFSGSGRYQGTVQVPMSGEWTVTAKVTRPDGTSGLKQVKVRAE